MTDRPWLIRVASASDATSIAQLLCNFNNEFDEPTPPPAELTDRFVALLSTGETLVVLGGEGPDGLVVLRFRASIWTAGLECHLAEFYVTPGARGKGLGRALLEASIEIAKTNKADSIDIAVDEPDAIARNLYESVGFSHRSSGDEAVMYFYELEL